MTMKTLSGMVDPSCSLCQLIPDAVVMVTSTLISKFYNYIMNAYLLFHVTCILLTYKDLLCLQYVVLSPSVPIWRKPSLHIHLSSTHDECILQENVP